MLEPLPDSLTYPCECVISENIHVSFAHCVMMFTQNQSETKIPLPQKTSHIRYFGIITLNHDSSLSISTA